MNLQKEFYNLFDSNKGEIIIMLDLDGTTDNLDDEKAITFIKQLEKLRQKFLASSGTICISTHGAYIRPIKEVLDILSRNLPETLKIGKSFFFGGIYEYDEDKSYLKGFGFNSNKVETFNAYYNGSLSTSKCIAIIDDTMSSDVYKKYQDKQPMLLCRPSQSESEKENDNFMSITSTIKGIDGVIECLDTYIKSIEEMTPQMILRKQQEMICHLPGYELNDKTKNREYEFLIKYFSLGFAEETDYKETLFWLYYTFFKQEPTKEELENVKKLLELIEMKHQIKNNLDDEIFKLDEEKFKEFKKTLYETKNY